MAEVQALSCVALHAGQWCGCVCGATRADKHQLVLRHAEDFLVLLVLCAHDLCVRPVT